jgi:hypothetical protein
VAALFFGDPPVSNQTTFLIAILIAIGVAVALAFGVPIEAPLDP